MKLHNTLTRTLEEFVPLDPARKRVGLYVCGPTVYDDPHIGHARSAFTFDILRRYLRYKGYLVRFVRNVTDVDDKIIEKAKQELEAKGEGRRAEALSAKCREVASRYLDSYHKVLGQLGLEPPDDEPKATEHLDPMLDLISKLVIDGNAYDAKGDVYFSVRKFERYGRLSNRTLDDLKAGARVEPGEQKQDPLDFALWKAAKPDEPSWKSPWGPGRPGWHIECSAMSTKYLGDAFDMHGGGVDLIFPHHENEVAQAQAAGKPFAKYWVHNGLLTVKGEKMSKSLDNFITVEKALEQIIGKDDKKADVLKMFFLGAHYRSPIDFTVESLEAARKRHLGVLIFLERAETYRSLVKAPSASKDFQKQVKQLVEQFEQAMEEDLNTPQALAVLDRFARLGNEYEQRLHSRLISPMVKSSSDASENQELRASIVDVADTIRRLASVFGLFQARHEALKLTPEQEADLAKYKEARKLKNFKVSDPIRKRFEKDDLVIEDTGQDSVVRRKQ